MTPEVRVGTILVEDGLKTVPSMGFDREPYARNWSVIRSLNALGLDRKIHAAGWNFFFMAAELKTIFFGAVSAENIRKALTRILARAGSGDFNCLEVTGITAKRFIGVPYTSVSAHWRHIQRSCGLDDIQQRRGEQKEGPWTRS